MTAIDIAPAAGRDPAAAPETPLDMPIQSLEPIRLSDIAARFAAVRSLFAGRRGSRVA